MKIKKHLSDPNFAYFIEDTITELSSEKKKIFSITKIYINISNLENQFAQIAVSKEINVNAKRISSKKFYLLI